MMSKAFCLFVAVVALCSIGALSLPHGHIAQPVACTAINECGRCVLFKECGWCSEEAACVPGDSAGPKNSTCATYDYQFCAGEPCNYYATCGSCTKSPWCAWCGDNDLCLPVGFQGNLQQGNTCEHLLVGTCGGNVIGQ